MKKKGEGVKKGGKKKKKGGRWSFIHHYLPGVGEKKRKGRNLKKRGKKEEKGKGIAGAREILPA